MSIPNEDDMWVSLYKNRLGFLYKSIDEYILIFGNEKLSKYIKDINKEYFNTSGVYIFTSVIRIINENSQYINHILEKEYDNKLSTNEKRFIREINLQAEIMEKIDTYKMKKDKFEEVMSDENMKLLNGIEKIYNRFINTMDRLNLRGSQNVYDRKVIIIIEVLQCYKNNLYNYFTSKISSFIWLSANLTIDYLDLNSIVSELDEVESVITKYTFEKYIDESEWKVIIERIKIVALEFIDILKRYELEVCINVKSYLINSIRSENERLKVSLTNIDSITAQRTLIEKELYIVKLEEDKLKKDNKQYLNNINIFKEIIRNNFISEYNRIINSINYEVDADNKLSTRFDYLYLITIEMNEMEEIIYD